MDTNETGGKELMAELVLTGGGDGVVQEKGVADRPVDDAIEDMGEEFALFTCQYRGTTRRICVHEDLPLDCHSS